jgi:hypothetical protein
MSNTPLFTVSLTAHQCEMLLSLFSDDPTMDHDFDTIIEIETAVKDALLKGEDSK